MWIFYASLHTFSDPVQDKFTLKMIGCFKPCLGKSWINSSVELWVNICWIISSLEWLNGTALVQLWIWMMMMSQVDHHSRCFYCEVCVREWDVTWVSLRGSSVAMVRFCKFCNTGPEWNTHTIKGPFLIISIPSITVRHVKGWLHRDVNEDTSHSASSHDKLCLWLQ